MPRTSVFRLTKKDFTIDTFRAGGPGGQNQNKVNSGVRISHAASGVSVECRETASQLENRKRAFQRLGEHPKFVLWCKQRAAEIEAGKNIEQLVDEQMQTEHIIAEGKEDGQWVVLPV